MLRTSGTLESSRDDDSDRWFARAVSDAYSMSNAPSAAARRIGLKDRLPSGVVGAVEAALSKYEEATSSASPRDAVIACISSRDNDTAVGMGLGASAWGIHGHGADGVEV